MTQDQINRDSERKLANSRIEAMAWATRCSRHDGHMRSCRYAAGEPCACRAVAALEQWA